MTIPEIRQRLYELSLEHGLPELAYLADETRRHYHGRKTPVVSKPLTPGRIGAIRAYVARHPTEPMHLVGIKFGVNQGRVSEALFGKREPISGLRDEP